MNYTVNEIFKSIQGEGLNLGKEVIFIRMAGCNLNCEWCDTVWQTGTEMTTYKIILKLRQIDEKCKSVIITGGEPTIQDLKQLLEELRKLDYWIGLETNGTNSLNVEPLYTDYITISPKGDNLAPYSLVVADEIRLVNDNLKAEDVLEYDRVTVNNKYLSVLEKDGQFNLKETIELLGQVNEKAGIKWRLNQQYHKILNIP